MSCKKKKSKKKSCIPHSESEVKLVSCIWNGCISNITSNDIYRIAMKGAEFGEKSCLAISSADILVV